LRLPVYSSYSASSWVRPPRAACRRTSKRRSRRGRLHGVPLRRRRVHGAVPLPPPPARVQQLRVRRSFPWRVGNWTPCLFLFTTNPCTSLYNLKLLWLSSWAFRLCLKGLCIFVISFYLRSIALIIVNIPPFLSDEVGIFYEPLFECKNTNFVDLYMN